MLALALNPTALNSFRYMLAAADIDTEDDLGTMRIQGAVVVFSRVMETWLGEDETDLSRTMAQLDKELGRGISIMQRFEDVNRLAAPFKGFFRAMGERSRDSRGGFSSMRERFDDMRDRFGGRRDDRRDDRAETR